MSAVIERCKGSGTIGRQGRLCPPGYLLCVACCDMVPETDDGRLADHDCRVVTLSPDRGCPNCGAVSGDQEGTADG